MRTLTTMAIALALTCSGAAAQSASTRAARVCPVASDNLECSPKQDCVRLVDTRDCHIGSVFRSEDPACLAAKASQNALYTSQFDFCEAQRTKQQELCEATREALKTAMLACKQSR
jgi:hypothetical protein